jgi:PPOX class probable FMN-dependent enzyme
MTDVHRIETTEQLRALMGEASPATAAKVSDQLDEFARDFIAKSPFLVLSTASVDGNQDASPKGDAPGFVAVLDDRTVVIPDRKGNKLLYGLENIIANPRVGLLFMVPGCEETLRLNGRAQISTDPALLSSLEARGQDALVAIRVEIDEVFFHCAKAFRRSSLWKPETWKPHTVSFGKIFAAKMSRPDDAEIVGPIDAAIERDYEENL